MKRFSQVLCCVAAIALLSGATAEDEENHPCNRECIEGETMTCHYDFEIGWYQSMSKACYDCPFNADDCNRKDCIPADGISRPLNVVNRKMPGPAITVCQGDRVIVDVDNELMTEGSSVHWHGMHQVGTPYMDGTPWVTQCPISPLSTFRYNFTASNPGTHFWHSHSGLQRTDGMAGAFIVRKTRSREPNGFYDYDKSEHVMLVTDWLHETTVAKYTDHHHSTGDNKPPALLVNGVGRFKLFGNDTDEPFYMKTAQFDVEKGYSYRFRLINAEFMNCPIEMTIDGHNFTLIASDGHDLEPIIATSLVSYAGERFDFVITADKEVDNYWIKFRGLMDCDDRFTKAKQVVVLHYEGAPDEEPAGNPTWEESHRDGLQLNALNKGEEDMATISIPEMHSLHAWDESMKEVPDHQFYITYDFYGKNNSEYHKAPYYGFNQMTDTDNKMFTPQLNHISMQNPKTPLLISKPLSSSGFCNADTVNEEYCEKEFCKCPHVLSVKLGSVVELVIIDEGNTYDANHPFHLHGYAFRVVGMRRLGSSTSAEEVKAYDAAGLLKRNLIDAPLKDTVTIPDGGYTVVRFKADNPGYWLFHCHIEFHVEVGMGLVFKVGENWDMPPTPPGFPTCGDYKPEN